MTTQPARQFKIRRGLDLPLTGEPDATLDDASGVRSVALLGPDYVGMRPTMAVKVGDHVERGQVIFSDKKTAGVVYTAPGTGTVSAVHRGEKRAFLSCVIDLDDDEEAGGAVSFADQTKKRLDEQTRDEVESVLVASGLWPSLRTRPFSRVPAPGSAPSSIFVTAIDTNPLAADPATLIARRREHFQTGLTALAKLTDGPVYLCQRPDANHLAGWGAEAGRQNIVTAAFAGPHPAGLAGTHIHLLDPVSASKTVWSIGYQDVLAFGALFQTGELDVERIVSIAGPAANRPRLVRTRIGANIDDLIRGEISPELTASDDASGKRDWRAVSGSVLSGRTAAGPLGFLGRYHVQVSLLREGRDRVFLGWQRPGFDKFSVKSVFASKLFPGKKFPLSTSTEGSRRAMVPIGSYEKVMPLDIEPTFLLRSLIVDDTDQAQALGCLELDEEDLGLCTFVCPGKYEYGPILRRNLSTIEKFG